MKKTTVVVVDDSSFMRSFIRDILNADPEIEVVAEAKDGLEALEKIKLMSPDLITLDLDMPVKNGIAVLADLRHLPVRPKIIVVSAYTHEQAQITQDCLSMGATNFLLKPSPDIIADQETFAAALISSVKTAVKPASHHLPRETTEQETVHKIAVIGASTGGPLALEEIISGLSETLTLPVVVVQHLPEPFVNSLVKRLSSCSKFTVCLAQEGMELQHNGVYFIPGGHDGTLLKQSPGKIKFSIIENQDDILTPSVDKILISAANIFGKKTIGIILTGMGKDGLLGAKAVKNMGGQIIVQDEASSAVYGMGREVIEAGLADYIIPLDQISNKIKQLSQNE